MPSTGPSSPSRQPFRRRTVYPAWPANHLSSTIKFMPRRQRGNLSRKPDCPLQIVQQRQLQKDPAADSNGQSSGSYRRTRNIRWPWPLRRRISVAKDQLAIRPAVGSESGRCGSVRRGRTETPCTRAQEPIPEAHRQPRYATRLRKLRCGGRHSYSRRTGCYLRIPRGHSSFEKRQPLCTSSRSGCTGRSGWHETVGHDGASGRPFAPRRAAHLWFGSSPAERSVLAAAGDRQG